MRMVSAKTLESLSHLLEVHYSLLRARWYARSKRNIFDEQLDLMIGATVELIVQRMAPVLEEAGFNNIDSPYNIVFIRALMHLVRGVSDELYDIDDPYYEVPKKMAESLHIADYGGKRKSYQTKLREMIQRHPDCSATRQAIRDARRYDRIARENKAEELAEAVQRAYITGVWY